MKKISLFVVAAVSAFTAYSQGVKLPENEGLNQLTSLNPQSGSIDASAYESGLNAINFTLSGGESSTPNRDANLFVTLLRDDRVISKVPVSNVKQLSFDGIYADVWQLSFFLTRSTEAMIGGYYQIVFDPGFFLMGADKTPSDPIVINYYIAGSEFTAVPASQSMAPSFQDITLTYAGVKSISKVDGKYLEIFSLYKGGDSIGPDEDEDDPTTTEPGGDQEPPEGGITPEITFEGNVVKLHFATPITEPGTWKLESSEGVFELTMADGTVKKSGSIDLYYIVPNYGDGKPTIFPEPGDVEYFPGTLTLTVPRGDEIKNVNSMAVTYLYPIMPNGELGNFIARFRAEKNPDNPREVLLKNWSGEYEQLVPAPGNYRLEIGSMTYNTKNTDSYVSKMSFDYHVYVYDEIPMVVEPADGANVKSLKEISFTFDESESVKVEWAKEPSWLQSATTNFLFYPYADETNPKKAIFRSPIEIDLPGEYTFTTATGALYIDGQSMVLTADYKISAESGVGCLENVTLLPAEFDIYDAQGILIKRNADVATLRALPAGIYIAGGKKFINK